MAESPDTTYHLTDLIAEKCHAVELALQRFVNGDDIEALHDLRVALRRLQSLLRIFDPGDSQAKNTLRNMLKSSNHARDLEVFPLILQQLNLSLPEPETKWRNLLISEIDHLRQTLPLNWQIVVTALGTIQSDNPQMFKLAAQRLHDDISRLQQRRDRLCQNWDDCLAHKLRISGKHVRYLLELFAASDSSIEECIIRMKGFQDQLGDYHDYTTLMAETDIVAEESHIAMTTLEKQMAQLRIHFAADHCPSHSLDHALHMAWQFLETRGRRESADVV